jgi:hypothetical protein
MELDPSPSYTDRQYGTGVGLALSPMRSQERDSVQGSCTPRRKQRHARTLLTGRDAKFQWGGGIGQFENGLKRININGVGQSRKKKIRFNGAGPFDQLPKGPLGPLAAPDPNTTLTLHPLPRQRDHRASCPPRPP